MPRIDYNTREEAESDAEKYDEYYDYGQLRTGFRPEEYPEAIGDPGSVLYNASWPVAP